MMQLTADAISDLIFNHAPLEGAYVADDREGAMLAAASDFLDMLPIEISVTPQEVVDEFLTRL